MRGTRRNLTSTYAARGQLHTNGIIGSGGASLIFSIYAVAYEVQSVIKLNILFKDRFDFNREKLIQKFVLDIFNEIWNKLLTIKKSIVRRAVYYAQIR